MSVLLPLILSGCSPATAILGSGDGAGLDTGSAVLPDDGATDADNPDAEVDGDADEPEPEPVILKSGTWAVTAVSIEDDPCDWEGALTSFGLDLLSLLPSTFEVSGEPDLFQIQATDYGAAGFIDCAIGGDGFDCEEQSVAPLDFDLGRFGWEYGITYFGDVDSAVRIRGEAVVRYPSVDDGTLYALQQYGYSLSDCTQTFYLEISHQD